MGYLEPGQVIETTAPFFSDHNGSCLVTAPSSF